MSYSGIPYAPIGALDGPNSKTTRSNPGWCAVRTAVSWACAFGSPPLWAAQASGGGVPVAPVGDGLGLGVGDGLAVGDGGAIVGAAVAGAAEVASGGTGCAEHAAPMTMASATVSGYIKEPRPANRISLNETMRCVDIPYKLRAFLYAERTPH